MKKEFVVIMTPRYGASGQLTCIVDADSPREAKEIVMKRFTVQVSSEERYFVRQLSSWDEEHLK